MLGQLKPVFPARPHRLHAVLGSAFTMLTYLRPFLEQVTGVDVAMLSLLLLLLGCAGFLGTWAARRFIKDNVAPLLKLPALVMGGTTAGLLLLAGLKTGSPFSGLGSGPVTALAVQPAG